MPEYIAIIICIYILAFTGVLKGPCGAMGISIFQLCYVLLCVISLSIFQLGIGVEISINLGAAVLAFMPGLMIEKEKGDSAGVGAVMMISMTIALLKYSGELYGIDSGLLCGLMAGASAFVYAACPSAALYAAGGIPIVSAALESFVALVFSGYAAVEIGHETITAQLIATCMCTVIIWINSLLFHRAGTE